jgi:hypothetical protein
MPAAGISHAVVGSIASTMHDRARTFIRSSVVHALCRFGLVLGLLFLAVTAAAHAQGTAVPIGSFDLAPGATDGKGDCPGAGGFDDLVYALLYQLPGDEYVVNMYRPSGKRRHGIDADIEAALLRVPAHGVPHAGA